MCIVEAEREGDVWVVYKTYEVSDPGECGRIKAGFKAKYEDAVCDAGTG